MDSDGKRRQDRSQGGSCALRMESYLGMPARPKYYLRKNDRRVSPRSKYALCTQYHGHTLHYNLQVKTTAKAGWLLGSHATVGNARDLEAALGLLPEMKGIPIEIRTEWIVTEKGVKTGLKAAHVLCEWKATLE